MFAVVRRYNVAPGMTGQVMELVQTEFADQIRQLPGFETYYLVDAGDGTLLSINVFRDQAGAEESNRVASAFVRERLGRLIKSAPTILSGEVGVALGAAMAAGG